MFLHTCLVARVAEVAGKAVGAVEMAWVAVEMAWVAVEMAWVAVEMAGVAVEMAGVAVEMAKTETEMEIGAGMDTGWDYKLRFPHSSRPR
jgi:hypothetical protein